MTDLKGVALREAVARKVMGWFLDTDAGCRNWSQPPGGKISSPEDLLDGVPAYELNIAYAWQVVDKLAGGELPRYGFCRYSVPGVSSMMRGVAVCFHSSVHPPDIGGEGYWGYSWEADTDEENTAIAICRAAVALMEAVNDKV